MLRKVSVSFLFGFALFASAQQTGTLIGTASDSKGQGLPGVIITAQSDYLPQPRTAMTNAIGNYRFAALPPGQYEITAIMTGLQTVQQSFFVRIGNNVLDITMAPEVSEEMVVTARRPLVDTSSAEQNFTSESETFQKIPLGQNYRDLLRLTPGVQVTEFSVRGPSSGGNGQDNIYKFDGVDVTLPLFGTLAAEPSNHDIEHVSIIKGGAKAVDFNRSGGLLVNSVSKSGTNSYKGEFEYIFQSKDWARDEEVPTLAVSGEEENSWASINYGGPLIKERLFFYASYFAPETKVSDRVNVYGKHPDGKQERDEFFGKLTYSPSENVTIHASHRSSEEQYSRFVIDALDDVGLTKEDSSNLDLTVIEADWVIGGMQNISFKYTDFNLDTDSVPERTTSAVPGRELGSTIDLNNIHTLGAVVLPTYRGDERDELYRPYIERYGFIGDQGQRVGGGTVGFSPTFDNNDFSRVAFQLGWNYFAVLGDVQHDLHVGFRHTEDEEDLSRTQQGLGTITFLSSADEFLQAEFLQPEGTDPIHSEYHSNNIELNDNITIGPWSFNVGVLLSNDELYGQDLTEDPSTPSGFRVSVGSKYKMYELDWADMIQPRFGVVRELGSRESVYANWAVYNPMASSLPRAASWARNRRSLVVRNIYNSDGVLVDSFNRGSTSGKFFQEDMDPREIQEVVLGYSKQNDNGWAFKFNSRYRYAHNFWEDTNNLARVWYASSAPADVQDEIAARGAYIPDLDLYRFGEEGQDNGIGGSSYVIAELDGAFTKYYEAGIDVEKRGDNFYFKGTYTWSHYYGNFDQDNASADNDLNIFIGSSFIADGAGRQLWDNKYGDLKGDRRHMWKLYGSYDLPWSATVGAFGIYQGGEPWETSDVEYYRALTGSSNSTNRFSEPAGSRRAPSHYQIDLNYTQTWVFSAVRFHMGLDIFNVLDRQTAYNIESTITSPNYGEGREYFRPQRFQLKARLEF